MYRRIVTVKRSLMDLLYIILIGQGMYDRLKYVSPLKIHFFLLVVIYDFIINIIIIGMIIGYSHSNPVEIKVNRYCDLLQIKLNLYLKGRI